MNCLAIDDEPLALTIIEDFTAKIPFVKLVATCTSAMEAMEILNKTKIDLIFLDINMPHLSGTEFLRSMDSTPMVIFTTAYSEYAVEGFDLNAIDYLVKPIAWDRFLRAVNKAYELYNLKQGKTNNETVRAETNYILVKADYATVKINLNEILYIEGLKDYVKIYCGPRPVITKTTMKNIEKKLPSARFLRIHKSFIISLSKIDSIENQRVIIGDKRIPVGDQYKDGFNDIINELRI